MENTIATKLATFLLLGFVVSFPLESLGFKIGLFRVSVPLLFAYMSAPLALLYVKWDRATFGVYVIMLSYFLLITMTRWPIGMVIKPLAALTLSSMIIFIRPKKLELKHLILAIHISLLIDLGFCLLNYLIFYSGLGNSMNVLLGSFYVGNPFMLKSGLLRMQGAFTEPAHHSIYCAFLLLLMFNFDYLKFGKKWFRLCMLSVASVLLFLSFSMTGYLLFLTVIIMQLLFGRARLGPKVGLVFLLLLFAAAAAINPSTRKVSFGRIAPIIDSFHGIGYQDGNWDSGRTAPFLVAAEYVIDKGTKGALVGEGYGNFEYWLARSYMGLLTSFSSGQVANITVAVFLGTGIIGVILFYLFLYSLFRDLHWKNKLLWFVFLQVFFLAFGMLVSHMLWGMLIIYRLFNNFHNSRLIAEQRQFQVRQPHAHFS